MNLYKLWDEKIRTGLIVLFIGFVVLLIFKHWSDEVYYQEQMLKLQIHDSTVFELTNGMTLTIYKNENTDTTTDSID